VTPEVEPQREPATEVRTSDGWPERGLARATVIYVWFGIAIFLTLSTSPISSGDSGGYRDATHRNFQLVLSSLEGHWLRSPTIIVPFTLLGSNQTIEVGQAVVLGLAFTFLITTVYRFESIGTPTKAVLGFLLATMLLSPTMLSWNLQILSEALAVSYAIFAFACCLRFLLGWSLNWLVASAAAAMLAISAKPPLALVFVPLIGAEVVAVVRQAVSARRAVQPEPEQSPRPTSLLPVLGAVVAVCVLVATGLVYATMQNNAQLASGIPNQKDSIVHLMSTLDPVNGAIRASLRSDGAPSCLPLDRPVEAAQIFTLEQRLIHSCPQFTTWSVAHYASWYTAFLLTNPAKTRLMLADLLPYSLGDDLNQQVVTAVIPPVSSAIWGSTSAPNAQVHVASPVLAPLAFEDAVYIAVLGLNGGGIWLFLSRRRRRNLGAERLRLYLCFLFVVDAAACVIVWQVFFLPLSGIEDARLALEANVLMRVSLILAAGLVAPFLRARWRQSVPRGASHARPGHMGTADGTVGTVEGQVDDQSAARPVSGGL
jgi:hypothetical protein